MARVYWAPGSDLMVLFFRFLLHLQQGLGVEMGKWGFWKKVVVDVTSLMETGCGMRIIHFTDQRIVYYWMTDFGALRMAGLIISTLSGVGNLKIATCRGLIFF